MNVNLSESPILKEKSDLNVLGITLSDIISLEEIFFKIEIFELRESPNLVTPESSTISVEFAKSYPIHEVLTLGNRGKLYVLLSPEFEPSDLIKKLNGSSLSIVFEIFNKSGFIFLLFVL